MNEIKTQLAKLEEERFLLEMKDHWTCEDSRRDDELAKEIKNLKKMLDK